MDFSLRLAADNQPHKYSSLRHCCLAQSFAGTGTSLSLLSSSSLSLLDPSIGMGPTSEQSGATSDHRRLMERLVGAIQISIIMPAHHHRGGPSLAAANRKWFLRPPPRAAL